MPTYSVTVNIAASGTPLLDHNGNPAGKSSVGHMWFQLSDGTTQQSFGFAPDPSHQGTPFAPGSVYTTDTDHYSTTDYSRTVTLTQAQYNAMLNFGRNPTQTDPATGKPTFDLYYNGLSNSCIDFTWKALEKGGINPAGFQGNIWPTSNEKTVDQYFDEFEKHQPADLGTDGIPPGSSTSNTYDSNGDITRSTIRDANGNVIKDSFYTYSSDGQTDTRTVKDGNGNVLTTETITEQRTGGASGSWTDNLSVGPSGVSGETIQIIGNPDLSYLETTTTPQGKTTLYETPTGTGYIVNPNGTYQTCSGYLDEVYTGLPGGDLLKFQLFDTPDSATSVNTQNFIDFTSGGSMWQLLKGLPSGDSEIDLYYNGANGTGADTKNIFDFTNGSSQEQLLTGLPSGVSVELLNFTGTNASGTDTSNILDFFNGSSERQDLTGLASGVSSQFEYFSGANATGTRYENLLDYSSGGSLEQLFNPYAGIPEEDLSYSGANATGTDTRNIFDLANGSSIEQFLSGLPANETMALEFFSGTNATGLDTKNIFNFTNGTSEEDLYTGLPSGDSSLILDFSGPGATGIDTKNILNFTNGGSEEMLFTGLSPGLTEENLFFTGGNATGTNTYDVYDLTSGRSYEQLLTGLPSGDTSDIEYFAGPNATGGETASVEDLYSGGSRITTFPGGGISEEIFNYTGRDGTGKDTTNIIDYTNNYSDVQQFTGLPNSTVTEEDNYYNGLNGTGRDIFEVVDQLYGSYVDTSFVYNSSGQLIGKNETAYYQGSAIGFTDYNLQTGRYTYETAPDGSTDVFDPGYSNGSFNSNNPWIDPTVDQNITSYFQAGCPVTGPDSDGDNDGDPLLLSLDRQGINLLPAGTVLFDFTGSGQRTPTGWMGADTGMLVLDSDGKGTLGAGTSVIPGFDALAALDGNHDGTIDNKDPAFSQLEVWGDSNANGTIEPGELHSLASLGIAAIGLATTPVTENVAGNTITAIGSLTFTDGSRGVMDDVAFASPAEAPEGGPALAPVVASANRALAQGESVAASSLFTATDPSGLAIAEYQFADMGSAAGPGQFLLDGTAQSNAQVLDVSAAQVSQVAYEGGAGSDLLGVRASNGAAWSPWSVFSATNVALIGQYAAANLGSGEALVDDAALVGDAALASTQPPPLISAHA